MIEIACAADRAFLPHTATMLASVLANAGGEVRVHVLTAPDVGRADRKLLAGVGDAPIEVTPVDARLFEGLKAAGPFPAAVWYRTALPQILRGLERVIYLDSDVLVLDSLVPLWESELGDAWIAAVTNVFPNEEFAHVHCGRLGLDPARYFNSGVLLMDLNRLRAARSFDRVRDFALANREQLIFPDQDTLNGALGEHRLSLHPRWNLMLGIEQHPWSKQIHGAEAVAAAVADPAIRHFEGTANKPWLTDAPEWSRQLWDRYRVAPERLGNGAR